MQVYQYLQTHSSVGTGGEEFELFGPNISGYITGITVTQGGSATEADIRIRLVSDSDADTDLIYEYNSAPLPLVDGNNGNLEAYFNTREVGDGQLYLYLEPDVEADMTVRIEAIIID